MLKVKVNRDMMNNALSDQETDIDLKDIEVNPAAHHRLPDKKSFQTHVGTDGQVPGK